MSSANDLFDFWWISTQVTSCRFLFLVRYAVTQLAIQSQQERIHKVCSNKVVRRLPTELNGTPAMDLGHMNVVLKWYIWMLVVDLGNGMGILVIMITTIMFCLVEFFCFFLCFLSSFVSFSLCLLWVHYMCMWLRPLGGGKAKAQGRGMGWNDWDKLEQRWSKTQKRQLEEVL